MYCTLLKKIKGTLKEPNVTPCQSHLCEIQRGATHTTEPHFDLF